MICGSCGHDNLQGEDVCQECGQDLGGFDLPAPTNEVEHSLMQDPVSRLSPPQALTIDVGATAGEAIRRLYEIKKGALLVTRDGSLAGIFTERDVLKKLAGLPADPATTSLESVMTANPATVRSTDTIALALNRMYIGGYRHLPVVDGPGQIAIISVKDILRYFAQFFESTAAPAS
ncbi:MAG: CBS domain-containing protein [Candidatus Wallbacteria bacterium]|nr:CBS domain-containing protein [Candidatus Wallbacteria bacterium]